jgi:hypothetical protein
MTIDVDEQKAQPKSGENPGDAGAWAGVKEAAEQMDKLFETVKEGKRSAERLLRRGRFAVEDSLEEGTHQIKRNPLASVTATFAVGMVAGILVGFFMRGAHKIN